MAIEVRGSRVMVTGGAGFLGSRVVAKLRDLGADAVPIRSRDYDLREPDRVRAAIADTKPRYVVHCAAVVGGIGANQAAPGRFFYENAVMGIHLVHEAWKAGVEKLVIVGTVCSYPKYTPVPFSEDSLWDGYPEETNAPYGLAKKILLVQAQAYRDEYGFNAVVVIPTNLYGPGDNFDVATSHVIPAIIRKFAEAQAEGRDEVTLWGTGSATRDFLHVEDGAEGIVRALDRYDGREPVNLGGGEEISIRDLAEMIGELCEFEGEIRWDSSKPDGQPRRSVDGSRAAALLEWKPAVSLRDGIRHVIKSYPLAAAGK